MGPSFSLEYYDRIFGRRSSAYDELLGALVAELADYAATLPVALGEANPETVSRLRHAHRPLVENLRLTRLRAFEDAIRVALETGCPGPELNGLGTQFQEEALSLVTALTSERFPTDPGPRPPSPGG